MNQSIENKFPRHSVVSRGVLSQPNPYKQSQYTPKIIDYRHTVRVITPFQCGHQNIIQNLKQQNELKSKEIEDLKKIIQIKNDQIQEKNREIDLLNEKVRAMKIKQKEDIQVTHNRRLSDEPVQFIESKIFMLKESFQQQEDRDTQNLNKIKKEIQNTQDILNDLSRIIEKPKQPYKFYNKHLVQSYARITPFQFNKKQDQTTCGDQSSRTTVAFDRVIQTSRSVQCTLFDNRQCQNKVNHLVNTSFDLTSTDESKDTTYFLQQAIKQHRFLQQSLIQLQNKTKNQIEELRQSYEQKIRNYVNLLERQKEKNERIVIESSQYNKFIVLGRDSLQSFEQIRDCQTYENNSFFDDLAQDNILIDTL